MFTQKRVFLCVCFLLAGSLFAVSASAQTPASDAGYKLTPSGSTNYSYAVHDVAVHDNVTDQDSAPTVIKKEGTKVVTDPSLIVSKVPATLTVTTAALLELHAIRKSAVDLCIQLPTKYRTHLPECAEIFKDEIRLERLAKDHP